MIGLHAAVLASYRRIVSMKDLKQVFEDMEDARRENFFLEGSVIKPKELREMLPKPA